MFKLFFVLTELPHLIVTTHKGNGTSQNHEGVLLSDRSTWFFRTHLTLNMLICHPLILTQVLLMQFFFLSGWGWS